MHDKLFSDTIGLIYEAGLNPDHWPRVLESLCQQFGASKAQMLYINPEDMTFSFACGYGFDPYAHNFGASKFRKYLTDDPVAQYALSHLDTAFSDRNAVDTDAMQQCLMHREIRAPAEMEYMLTNFISDDSVDWSGFSFFRGPQEASFSKKEEQLFNLYTPHLRRATNIHKTISGTSHRKTLQNAVLDHLDTGIVVVDEMHEVVACNQKASSLITESGVLKIRENGALVCDSRTENSALHNAIDRALGSSSDDTNERKIGVRLLGRDGKKPLLAVTTRLRLQKFEEKRQKLPLMKTHYTATLPNRKHVLITICNPSNYNNSWTGMLQDLFELTPAEAALANCLADDRSVKEAAKILGRSEGTARIQLQSIFEKTDTNRQSSLVRLLMAIP